MFGISSYYYAIVTCDSSDTAAHIMSELDGTELERTANIFDISFVPEDITFNDEPRHVLFWWVYRHAETIVDCSRDSANSKTDIALFPNAFDFATSALCHSKVSITWDEDNLERRCITRRTFTPKDIEKENFESYVASSSSDEADEAPYSEAKLSKTNKDRIRGLLLGATDRGDHSQRGNAFGHEKNGGEMEIIFTAGLSTDFREFSKEKTTLDTYRRKRREHRTQKMDKRKAMSSAKSSYEMEGGDLLINESDHDSVEKLPTQWTRMGRTEDIYKNVEIAASIVDTAVYNVKNQLNHFNMELLTKEQKATKGKQGKRASKKLRIAKTDDLREDFLFDTRDERFSAIHKDYNFAIDPGNPQWEFQIS